MHESQQMPVQNMHRRVIVTSFPHFLEGGHATCVQQKSGFWAAKGVPKPTWGRHFGKFSDSNSHGQAQIMSL